MEQRSASPLIQALSAIQKRPGLAVEKLHVRRDRAAGRGCPESILPVVVMDCGLARSLSSGGAERRSTNGAVVYPGGLDPAHPSASGAKNFRRTSLRERRNC